MRKAYAFQELATYNAEVARGIVHTPAWNDKMGREQARFDGRPWPPQPPLANDDAPCGFCGHRLDFHRGGVGCGSDWARIMSGCHCVGWVQP